MIRAHTPHVACEVTKWRFECCWPQLLLTTVGPLSHPYTIYIDTCALQSQCHIKARVSHPLVHEKFMRAPTAPQRSRPMPLAHALPQARIRCDPSTCQGNFYSTIYCLLAMHPFPGKAASLVDLDESQLGQSLVKQCSSARAPHAACAVAK